MYDQVAGVIGYEVPDDYDGFVVTPQYARGATAGNTPPAGPAQPG